MICMKLVEYIAPVGVDGRRRVQHERVVGFAHRDLMHPDGRKEKIDLLSTDLNI
jgi:hypothetical protein